MSFFNAKSFIKVTVIVVLLGGVVSAPVSAAPTAKEGAKCTKVGAKVKVSKTVSLVCTRYPGKTKVLKWKKVVTAKPKTPVTTTTVPRTSTTAKITIKGFVFTVASGIKKSDVITISNEDSVPHTVTFDPNALSVPVSGYSVKKTAGARPATVLFDVSVPGNSTATLPPLGSGSYSFLCNLHPTMKGTLIIG